MPIQESDIEQLRLQPATQPCPDERTITEEECKLDLEESDSLMANVDVLLKECVNDFPEEDGSEIAMYAARIARASITEDTRAGHTRIIKAYILFHLKLNPKWDPKGVTKDTPYDIRKFITHKCGARDDGYEGRRYSTAVSIRAALTLWYRNIRPNNNSAVEWRYDEGAQVWLGLPTRSRVISQFMVGLEKTKARAGEISQSARALSLEDMHRLHEHCLEAPATAAEQRWGTIRYAAYLLAFLMLLRIDEVTSIQFEGMNIIPGEREYFEVNLRTRKAQQTGLLNGWRLYANDGDPKICPMRAMIRLAMLYGEHLNTSGTLFLKVSKQGAVMQGDAVTNSLLSRALTNDLQNLGYISWPLYGTHSFRRGGCQHRIKNKGWTVDMVAAWGGWSQVEAVTMFRYFYSPNDNHEHMVEYDRNDPKRQKIMAG